MKVHYDPELDIVRIRFSNEPVDESDEEKPDMIIDYSANGSVVGIEILDASLRIENPRQMDYAIAS
ncbi:MAG: DUF2283 domain-containing protein [Fimbriimonas sp.]